MTAGSLRTMRGRRWQAQRPAANLLLAPMRSPRSQPRQPAPRSLPRWPRSPPPKPQPSATALAAPLAAALACVATACRRRSPPRPDAAGTTEADDAANATGGIQCRHRQQRPHPHPARIVAHEGIRIRIEQRVRRARERRLVVRLRDGNRHVIQRLSGPHRILTARRIRHRSGVRRARGIESGAASALPKPAPVSARANAAAAGRRPLPR